MGHEALALAEFKKTAFSSHMSCTEAAVAVRIAKEDILLFFAVAGLHTKESEAPKDKARRFDNVRESLKLGAERKQWLSHRED